MGNRDLIFKGQNEDEHFVCFFRRHWVTILGPFIMLIILIVLFIYIAGQAGRFPELLIGNREAKLLFYTIFVGLTISYHRMFYKIFNYFINTGIITDSRIIDHKKKIFFKDIQESVRMEQIQDIERITEGFVPNLLGYGEIRIYLNAASAIKVLHHVPNAKFHFRCINRGVDEARNRASGIKNNKTSL